MIIGLMTPELGEGVPELREEVIGARARRGAWRRPYAVVTGTFTLWPLWDPQKELCMSASTRECPEREREREKKDGVMGSAPVARSQKRQVTQPIPGRIRAVHFCHQSRPTCFLCDSFAQSDKAAA